MKNPRRLLLFVSIVLVTVCFAQVPSPVTNSAAPIVPPAAMSLANLIQLSGAIVVPLILAGAKRILPQLPSAVIPYLAPLLGIVYEFLKSAVSSHPASIWSGIILGVAGIGIRELKDKVLPATNGGWPLPNP